MENLYEQLGFRRPEFIENPYGIRIYLGTKGEDDWCVEIPNDLLEERVTKWCKCKRNMSYVVYFVTEHDALDIAKKYTERAKLKYEGYII